MNSRRTRILERLKIFLPKMLLCNFYIFAQEVWIFKSYCRRGIQSGLDERSLEFPT